MKQVRRWAIGGMTTAAAGVLMASAAWACVSGPVVNLSTINAKAGQEIGVTGTGFQTANAAQVRWNALDGPVLASINAPITGGNLDTKITVPEGTKAGSYVLIVTQSRADGTMSLSPVRAVLNVTGDAGTNPVLGATASTDTGVRADSLARSDDSISTGTLALVALGVGGVGMFLAGMAALFAGRKSSSAPEAAKARS
jgi:hypothetical protein